MDGEIMSQIIVDVDRLGSYSSSLNSKKEEFAAIKGNMLRIINELRTCWSGKHCDAFIKNAESYLYGLRKLEESLEGHSNEIRSQQNMYQARIASAMSKLG